MRTILCGFWIVGGLAALSSGVTGCTADCSVKDSCGPYIPPEAGASGVGTAGASGMDATSGASGTENGGTGGGAGRAGSGNSAGDAGAAGAGGPPCDKTKSPREESCLISNEYSVFVAPNGKANAAGTMNAPLATLSKAIALAAGTKFVIVCDATYDEHVTVTKGAEIYGGFKCPGNGGSWVAETGAPLFKPSDAGPALKIDGVAQDVVIESVKFEVPAATQPGGTALTALVNASPKVTLSHVSLTAGSGAAGPAGTLTAFAYKDQLALNGKPELVGALGGEEKPCACQTGLMSVGGAGGPPADAGQNGADGLPAQGGGQAGDHTKSCNSGGGGGDGADAVPATASEGALSLGTPSPSGWQPTPGRDGATGSPGQGGGGGASRNNSAHGGGGGCGGCGGNGGTAGKGGGGSIALLLIDSPVTLNASTLTTADAGDGGAGIAGQPGQQTAGGGGNSILNTNSCAGGAGGKGGDGGASGGGAGGISVGVVWKGTTAPTLTDTTTITGNAGAKGVGGVPGTNDGIAGVKQDVLQVP